MNYSRVWDESAELHIIALTVNSRECSVSAQWTTAFYLLSSRIIFAVFLDGGEHGLLWHFSDVFEGYHVVTIQVSVTSAYAYSPGESLSGIDLPVLWPVLQGESLWDRSACSVVCSPGESLCGIDLPALWSAVPARVRPVG